MVIRPTGGDTRIDNGSSGQIAYPDFGVKLIYPRKYPELPNPGICHYGIWLVISDGGKCGLGIALQGE